MVYCKICGKQFKSNRGLSIHIVKIHKIEVEKYYIEYINSDVSIDCEFCGNPRIFINLTKGFTKTCGSSECKHNRYKKTCLERYGVDNSFKSECIKEKIKRTNLERYGVESPIKNKRIYDKVKSTNVNRYGVENISSLNENKIKIKNNNLKKYGVDHHSKLDSNKNKVMETCLDKYKETHHLKSKYIRDKIKMTCLEKYDGNYTLCNYDVSNRIKNDLIHNLDINRPDIEYIEDTDEFAFGKNKVRIFKCKHCETIFKDYARSSNNWLHPRCPTCNPIRYTSIENKVYKYLESILNGIEIIRCTKQVIKPYELDLYIPSLNLAIECDGDYWHSDEIIIERYGITNEEYCNLKDRLCSNKSIILLRFTEREINNEFSNVKSKLREYIL